VCARACVRVCVCTHLHGFGWSFLVRLLALSIVGSSTASADTDGVPVIPNSEREYLGAVLGTVAPVPSDALCPRRTDAYIRHVLRRYEYGTEVVGGLPKTRINFARKRFGSAEVSRIETT
jgi:hypothetical protein